jgi:sulfite reductase (NADPH) flavoprotein alpha-component
MTVDIPPHPFSHHLWREVEQLLGKLNDAQAIWLSRFLQNRQPVENIARDPAPKIAIAFGGETGNSERLARRVGERAREQNVAMSVLNLADVKLRQLGKFDYAFIICSTHGDGEPPEPVRRFYEELMSADAPACRNLRYAVLALGDSTYEQFCATGQRIDARLAELGAERVLARRDCDVDYEKSAQQWMVEIFTALARVAKAAATAIEVPRFDMALSPTESTPKATEYSKQRPLTVTVAENICLSELNRYDAVHHLELLLDSADFRIRPGDAVGVLARNPERLVQAVLNAVGANGEQMVLRNDGAAPLADALRDNYDLVVPSKNFLEFWAAVSGSAELRRYVAVDSKTQRQFLRRHQIFDLMTHFPARPDAQELIENLRPLQPRLYDVANSQSAGSDELHLTVKHYRYDFFGRGETGIASDYLVKLRAGDKLRIYPHRNERFQLPDDIAAPLILVAEGTGIAPYRAFIQEIQAGARTHACWLFFCEENFESDFFYQLEWQEARHSGVLARVDTVFSRAPAKFSSQKNSLEEVLLAHADQLQSWLRDGARIYLCGDKELLTRCEKNLQAHFEARAATKTVWDDVNASHRLHRNLY